MMLEVDLPFRSRGIGLRISNFEFCVEAGELTEDRERF